MAIADPASLNIQKIANHIKQALDDVYNGAKGPKQALNYAAAKSARLLGW